MNKKIIALIIVVIIILVGLVAVAVVKKKKAGDNIFGPQNTPYSQHGQVDNGTTTKTAVEAGKIPKYVVVVHLDPAFMKDTTGVDQQKIDKYLSGFALRTKEEVDCADKYGVKLSLFFSAHLADFIAKDSKKLAEVQKWMKEGHEIGLHHHSTYRNSEWDGYTKMLKGAAIALRTKLTGTSEPYNGTLVDMMNSVKKLNPNVKSGVNSEYWNKSDAMPDEILYSTGAGILNKGPVGAITTSYNSPDTSVGVNEYIVTGVVNGIKRKWLSHYEIGSDYHVELAEKAFLSLPENAFYAVVTHNDTGHPGPLCDYLEFLHKQDPKSEGSMTISEAMESGLFKEEPVKLRCEELGGSLCDPSGVKPAQKCDGTLLINEPLYQCCSTSCSKI